VLDLATFGVLNGHLPQRRDKRVELGWLKTRKNMSYLIALPLSLPVAFGYPIEGDPPKRK